MRINGIHTKTSQVTIDVSPREVLDQLKNLAFEKRRPRVHQQQGDTGHGSGLTEHSRMPSTRSARRSGRVVW